MRVRTIATTASTNDDMAALARAGAAEGLWLRAETQSGGRGRHGRAWLSPPGNLYASTLVRLLPGDPQPATLALVAAVALDELVSAYVGPARAMIKWPNDLLIDGAKLSGILLERAGEAVVIGFGVNLAHHPQGLDRPVTSLAAVGIEPPGPELFAEDLARAFARWLGRWRGEGLAPVRLRWLERAHAVGTPLVANLESASVEGLFEGLDESGALRLRRADGGVETIHAGDVFLL
ncbi:biotin--[acetyl-CoA-carboxylase] ligase [Sphingomonas oleivorans]|uniref:biotin--[biotin carboxyl-carrier protein] ligase n=1 Tax=Sphingomonas oleivorans TaxID=1735121 RepID=A0A2T5FYP8_9SPHN|nr:biotin--[acetyl-CoA-carboxylase] ligase [Sphingomonas oleivorans]PTQ11670.1 biotin--[acetyl-CoA-carboxylase] ligase [Sphingomonas oleivorans]